MKKSEIAGAVATILLIVDVINEFLPSWGFWMLVVIIALSVLAQFVEIETKVHRD